ncbi:cyclin-domain-containing protein [Pseudovirgaria hyperparasitica]|uniref:Cyclin-domain-containing protein n=1 Tax=Pseudovirgaria hyperparasitica TaxID=470096 RepID=A0A6A6WLQ4_9PEZI|nr:cyclin-domain-containing protein [Pseudovirgaria hyperparasitica]KAF2763135.1 cyclin-domain-containing protein [Pseudovirgaria hyperparasitica]
MGSPNTPSAEHNMPTTVHPPSPPNPSADHGVIPHMASPDANAPSPPAGDWDPSEVAPETAMKLLCRAVTSLAFATGDVPPTPPVSRPSTPRRSLGNNTRPRTPSRPATPVSSADLTSLAHKHIQLGSPEACEQEPATVVVGHDTEDVQLQRISIARKFFSKRPPAISLEDYLLRLQRYCPMSTAVYLAACAYIYKLAVEDKIVPVTGRTIHRLVLAALRVAMKALEDLKYPHSRYAGVGGVSERELQHLEISLCYLTDFDLQLSQETMVRKTTMLQQTAAQLSAARSKLPLSFQLDPNLPLRVKRAAVQV